VAVAKPESTPQKPEPEPEPTARWD
jgi:hypothetical protein